MSGSLPFCNPLLPSSLPCQAPATNLQLTDILYGTQGQGPQRANQTVQVSLAQVLDLPGSMQYVPFQGSTGPVDLGGVLTVAGQLSAEGAFYAKGAVSGPGITALFAAPPPIGSTTANAGIFTNLTATGTVTLPVPTFPSQSQNTVFAAPSGAAGVPSFRTIVSSDIATALLTPGLIGSTTANAAAFTSLSASGAISGNGFSNYLASPPPIGNTAANTGSFTTLAATGTVSGAGVTALFASPPSIGNTTAGAGAFTTLAASGAVSGAGITTLFAAPPPIGTTTANTLNGIVTATGSTTGRSLAARFSDIMNVFDEGVVPSLSVDQAPNLQAAINLAATNGQGTVFIPAGQFRCASGLTIPNGIRLVGAGCFPYFGTTLGTVLVFDSGVSVCITMGAASNNDSCVLQDLTVGRAGGEPALSTVAVKLLDSLECVLKDVFASNHGIGFYLRADTTFGTYMFAERIYTAAIADAHFVADSWPGARIHHAQFGSNGGHDYACNAYVRLTGGNTTNAAGGPNTIVFDSYHFNQSGGTVGAMVQFSSQTSGSISTVENFNFTGGHCETVNYGLQNDSTWPALNKITFNDSSINCNTDFFNLVGGTTVKTLTITDNTMEGPMNLVASGGIVGAIITGNNVALHNVASSVAVSGTPTVVLKNNTFGANLTVSGTATGGAVTISGNVFTSGAFVCSVVSQYLDIDQPGWAGSWTPGIAFGGASTGITYATQSGTWQIKGGWVEAEFQVSLSAVGTATGAAGIVGLPLPSLVTSHANGSGVVTEYFNMASMVSLPTLVAEGSEAYFQLQNGTQSIQYTNANFTSTTAIHGYLRYRVL